MIPGIGTALALIALYAVGVQIASAVIAALLGSLWFWRSLLLGETVLLAWLAPFLRRYDLHALGLRPVGWREGVVVVLWFQAIAIAMDAVVLWLAPAALVRSYLASFHPAGLWEWLALGTVAVILAPTLEELLFRGVLLAALRRHFHLPTAVLGSAVLFALVHIKPVQIVAALPLGWMLAHYVARGGSLYVTIAAHMAGNGLSLLGLLLPGVPWISASWRPSDTEGLLALGCAAVLLTAFARRPLPNG
ncbi:hypothetical protein MIT9_P0434 [Methylomarinovum caldicuralii]|uniref:CAAX prenyl protease 2/Lysostaphin resistance protein A-like domain-containing protein n=1 Tax=Methylomarinovum caldicuralii TaxID=438856 RepID=A0AAU9C5Y2_9GAMM|nr:type II CAAX endopeptidase family protein [Methylomarinovum caldicuralii]BCX80856.1 hypothetical protein MIT9_P0434 [Methylomarinovum caldicuralii]